MYNKYKQRKKGYQLERGYGMGLNKGRWEKLGLGKGGVL